MGGNVQGLRRMKSSPTKAFRRGWSIVARSFPRLRKCSSKRACRRRRSQDSRDFEGAIAPGSGAPVVIVRSCNYPNEVAMRCFGAMPSVAELPGSQALDHLVCRLLLEKKQINT